MSSNREIAAAIVWAGFDPASSGLQDRIAAALDAKDASWREQTNAAFIRGRAEGQGELYAERAAHAETKRKLERIREILERYLGEKNVVVAAAVRPEIRRWLEER